MRKKIAKQKTAKSKDTGIKGITVRLNPSQRKTIEQLKLFTRQTTASGSLMRAAEQYEKTYDELVDTRRELNRLQQTHLGLIDDLESVKRSQARIDRHLTVE